MLNLLLAFGIAFTPIPADLRADLKAEFPVKLATAVGGLSFRLDFGRAFVLCVRPERCRSASSQSAS